MRGGGRSPPPLVARSQRVNVAAEKFLSAKRTGQKVFGGVLTREPPAVQKSSHEDARGRSFPLHPFFGRSFWSTIQTGGNYMSADTDCYGVYAYTLLDGMEVTCLVAFLYGYECACRLARYSFRIGAYKAEVFECEDNGDLSLVWSGLSEEFNRNEVLESLRQLREAGAIMPDPEDSPLFATPIAPMRKV